LINDVFESDTLNHKHNYVAMLHVGF